MRSLRIRPIAHSVKILTAGALLAAGTAGCALPGASAADVWTVVVRADAIFWCLSDCNAGGVGSVSRLERVSSNESVGIRIGAWKRTVAIQCKSVSGFYYRGTVRDVNWTGMWEISRGFLEGGIDDSSFPVCSAG